MKLTIESKIVKRAVVKFVKDDLLGDEYDTETAKVVITKGGTAEVTIDKIQAVMIDTTDEKEA